MAEQLERRGERPPARFGGLDYAPAPEATDHVTLRADHGLLIGGRWVEPASERRFKTISPATEEVLADASPRGHPDPGRPAHPRPGRRLTRRNRRPCGGAPRSDGSASATEPRRRRRGGATRSAGLPSGSPTDG